MISGYHGNVLNSTNCDKEESSKPFFTLLV